MYEKYATLRDSRGLNDNRVSKETGIATATLTSWKTGKYKPKVEKLLILSKYFDVPLDYFLKP